MGNLVEIKYGKCEIYPKILINGNPMSRYMGLSDHIYEDIFCWANNFFDIMDSEFSEEYTVSIIGHRYHEIVLREAMSRSEYCKEIAFEENQYRISLEDKYKYALELNSRYSLIPEYVGQSLSFVCVDFEKIEALSIPGLRIARFHSDYSIGFDGDDIVDFSAKYCILISDKHRVLKQRSTIIIYVTIEELPILIDYLNTYHIYVAAIESIFSKMVLRSFDDEVTMVEFDAYSKDKYRILLNDIPRRLEEGSTFNIEYDYFPKCFEAPRIKILTSDASVLEIDNNALIAENIGTCTVSITDASGDIYELKQIEIFKHNYVTDIEFELPKEMISVGDTLNFKAVITPSNAEDIGEITYSVSDDSMAIIKNSNQLYALAAGRVCVTASTPRVTKQFSVEIFHLPTKIIPSRESMELTEHTELMVACTIIPDDIMPGTRVLWAVSNESIIQIKDCDSKKCRIEALGEGKALLLCKIDGVDNVITRIPVTVTKAKANAKPKGKAKSKGCYVATSVYGSYDCPQVWVLRRFRDNYLDKHWAGRRFIDAYYAVSPKAVALFGKRRWFNSFFKKRLDKLVCHLQSKGYEETPYVD